LHTIIDFINGLEDDFVQGLKELEPGLTKSTLEEFEFREYGYLYEKYREFMSTLQFVVDSIADIENLKKLPNEIIRQSPHFVINYIVSAGGHMRIINEVCGRSILSFRGY